MPVLKATHYQLFTKEDKMSCIDFYVPKSKKEFIDWLYWFYDGRITKSQIRKKNVKKWYFKIRLSGQCKQTKLAAVS